MQGKDVRFLFDCKVIIILIKMESFRLKWCYTTITVTVWLAILCRLIYWHHEEFAERPDKKRLDIRFSFTQIPLINKYMLFWSLSVIVLI